MIDTAKCPDCEAGWTPAATAIYVALGKILWNNEVAANPQLRAVGVFLTGREPHHAPICYDSLAAYDAMDKLGELAGLKPGWSRCPTCGGSGETLSTPDPT